MGNITNKERFEREFKKNDKDHEFSGKPWDRQLSKSDAQFRAFLEFLNMPRDIRSHDGAYRRTYQKGPEGRSPKWFREWSWKNRWKERAKAFDQNVTDQLREEVRQRAVKLAETRLNAYQIMVASGMAIFSKAKIAELTMEEARKLIPQAVRMIQTGAEGVRREMGEAEDQRPGMAGVELDALGGA